VSFDNSRFTFNPRKDYAGVVMQQGRIQLDSDWNEWLAEVIRRTQAGTLDTLGRAVYPATTPFAFHITASSSGGTSVLKVGPGRLYVDGLLAENHGDPATVRWDPALAEMSNTPQPPPGTETGAIDFTQQPFMPPGTKLPAGNGPFLAYLDVWIRPVDYLNDPDLIDKAVGVDSTGRLQTVWQVRLLDLANSPGATCDSPIANFPPAPSAGLLTTGTTPTAPSGPCCLTSGSAYTGQENQFYRVQIHQRGAGGASAVPPAAAPTGATFIWSRDNGSVITGVTAISNVTNSAGNPASQLAVLSLGRDQVLGFAPGNWIEILDDSFEFAQTAGELHQIDTIDVASKTVTLATTLGASFKTGNADPTLHTRIRRWDQSGKVYEQDGTTVWWDIDAQARADIPVPPAGTSLILENGITVSFDVSAATGRFVAGDFWTFAARTADGSVEKLAKAAPRGIHHHYARLSIVTFPNSATDCRTKWPPSTGDGECGCCCTVTVGDGVESVGKFTSINAAIGALPANGGEVCVLPGRYFENVLIKGRRDIVIHGCGWQTRIASASLNPAPVPAAGGTAGGVPPAATGPAGSTFNAVITITESEHVQLLSFAVEAAREEVGILVDGTATLSSGATTGVREGAPTRAAVLQRVRTVDVTLEDLIVTASTRPAILAHSVELLQIESNRVAMENVGSQWPAVWVSGREIRVVHNWVGIQSKAANREWLPATVNQDLAPAAGAGSSTTIGPIGSVPLHPGGIQIGGPATDVFVVENEIDGAGRNGITLGSLIVVGTDGRPTRGVTGVTIEIPGPCDTKITLTIPGSTTGGQDGGRIVVAGTLLNIQINRNRIRNTGLCGIGPVGFFNLVEALEIISIENLTIAANTIASTLLSELDQPNDPLSVFGYGAICVPDVENLAIRDNNVTDFGREPGDPACGIFVLHGEMVEISRNHVLETRDWARTQNPPPANGLRAGIMLLLVTPPTFKAVNPYTGASGIAATQTPVYLPNLSALRVEHNTVRVALGNALAGMGFGPFSIVNNHLATGGTVTTERRSLAETVLLLNLSLSIESQTLAGKFSQLGKGQLTFDSSLARGGGIPACGAVIFTNNTCQLESRLSGQRAIASVMIFALDDLIFGHNECWLDGRPATASVDALLAAGSLQVTSNRFQEAAGFPVLASGFTLGALNITSQNVSTYCLFATGTLQPAIDNNNLSLMPAESCQAAARNMKLNFTN
jgi:uncharacterized protein DUF6519